MSRGKRFAESKLEKQKAMYILGVIVLIFLIALIFVLSGINSKNTAKQKIAEIEEETFDASLVSQSDDKNITEVIEEENENTENEVEKIAINTSILPENTPIQNETKEIKEEPKKKLEFIVPVKGEINKDFSDSSLVYSETLEEWTVHLGIDIKAEKGTPVIASEEGIVESIKNDPRYGLTVIISHQDGYKTIYSNLQTAESVEEGQTVEKGKTIGSVGENASFEITEGPHLHFEMSKDGEKVNPSIYWKK